MKKIILLVAALAVAIGFIASRKRVIEVGNKLCPVSGRPVDGVTTHIVNGKKYNLCSKACSDQLQKNPDKY